MIARLFIFGIVFFLSGCDIAALLADPKVVQREADGKAIGSACRHGLRSIEDCYAINEKAPKAAIFTGWKDMDLYMRENNIEGIAPQGLKPTPPPDEEIIEDPKPKKSGKDKASTDSAENPKDKIAEKDSVKEPVKASK
jgi:hypothetical protein